MAKSNSLETGILKLIYQNIALPNIGNAGGLLPSSVAGSLYVALYTEGPTDADTGIEATYTGYARVAVVRSIVGWTILENEISNAGLITFGTNTGVSQTVTHISIRTASSGGDIIHYGALAVPLVIENGNIPKFEIGNLAITES